MDFSKTGDLMLAIVFTALCNMYPTLHESTIDIMAVGLLFTGIYEHHCGLTVPGVTYYPEEVRL